MAGSMGSFNISGLVKAGMLILGIATVTGHFEDVQRWAIMEFAKSITTVKPTYFPFPDQHPRAKRPSADRIRRQD